MNMFCWFSDPWLDFVWIWITISSSAFVNKCNYMNPGGFLAQYPLENPLGNELYIYTCVHWFWTANCYIPGLCFCV